jgi:hypothetical protein
LAIGGHDWLARSSADRGIADPFAMLLDELRPAPSILAGHWRNWGDDDRDLAARRDPEHTETQSSAEVAKTHIAFATVPPGRQPRCDPDFVSRRCSIDRLKNELEIEGELQFANYDQWRFASFERYEIAAAHFPFDQETKVFEEALDGQIERAFQSRTPADESPCCQSGV